MDFREDLREEDIAVLEGLGRKVSSRPGESLSFDPHYDALFVLSGALQAKGTDVGGHTVMRRYTTGDVINELSVVTAHVSLSNVTALIPSVSLVVSHDSVDNLVTDHPRVAARLFRHFAKLIIYRAVPLPLSPSSSASVVHNSDSLSAAC